MTVTNNIKSLEQFHSNRMFNLESRTADTYLQPISTQGNSILSTVYVSALGGGSSVEVKYFDTITSESASRFDLGQHAVISSAPTVDRKIITKIHDQPVVEVIVVGTATFAVYVTLVADFASDLNSALQLDGALADLLNDQGTPGMCLSDSDGKFFFNRCPADTPLITNKTVALKDVEETHTLAINTKTFTIKCRASSEIKLAYILGDSGLIFDTIPRGVRFSMNDIRFGGSTLFFQTDKDAQVVEITEWS